MPKRAAIAALAVALLVTLGLVLGFQGTSDTARPSATGPARPTPAELRDAAAAAPQSTPVAPKTATKAREPSPAPAQRPPEPKPTATPSREERVKADVRQYLDAIDRIEMPKADEVKQTIRPYQDQVRGMLEMNADITGDDSGEFCDYNNAIVYSMYSWMLSMGIPNGRDIGLPDYQNPCPAEANLGGKPW